MIGSIGGLETVAVALPAGRYVVAPMAETGSLGLRATPNIPAPDCDAAEPLALPATDGNLTIAAANRETPLFLRIGRPQKPSFELTRSWDHPIVPDKIHATLEICSDCSGGTCRPFDGLTRAPIASGEILRLTGLDAPPGATMIRLRFN
jgi:hypothetical protein